MTQKAQLISKIEMFGVSFDNYDFDDLLLFLDRSISERRPAYLLTCNVDHLVKLQQDDEFRRIYTKADAVVADGMPVLWASKLLRRPLKHKVSGSDLFDRLGKQLAERQYRLFFLGASDGIAAEAARRLRERYPMIRIVGCYSPSYGFESNELENVHIVNILREAAPDILFVGVGAPKQEKWIYKYYQSYRIPISIGVGATFDFLSGNVKRAPRLLQRVGLEWFWRLCQEPRRLWRRYLVEDMLFVKMLLLELAKRKGGGSNV